MKVLILGGSGALGHKAWQVFKEEFDTYVTIRDDFTTLEKFGIFERRKTLSGVDALIFPSIVRTVEEVKPDVILNCIGIVKQKEEAKDPIKSIEVNSLFPQRLASVCAERGIRLIHVSTDCIFSGKKGSYKENDIPDPEDLYGRTKLLGEVTKGNALTMRTSIIGHELKTKQGLLEWFLSQEGKKVKGFTKAIYSGFPTITLCNILKDIILTHKKIRGLYHVSGPSIDKYALLSKIKSQYGLNVEIERYDGFICDRSLDSSLFKKKTGFKPEGWDKMISDMYENNKTYKNIYNGVLQR